MAPWSLLTLFESGRAFAFWPIPHAERPEGSFLDSHQLLAKDLYFIATAKLHIDKEFHNSNAPKFPLTMDKVLSFVGNSSFRLDSTLNHPENSKPYATCSVQTVFVDSTTRKPKVLPDWWKEKYACDLKKENHLKFEDFVKNDSITYHSFPLTVCPRDTDSYHHSNWTSYIRFCYDACVHGVANSQYRNITEASIEQGIKTLDVTFKNESSDGDNLDIVSWEDQDDNNTIRFEVRKDHVICCLVNICFYSTESKL